MTTQATYGLIGQGFGESHGSTVKKCLGNAPQTPIMAYPNRYAVVSVWITFCDLDELVLGKTGSLVLSDGIFKEAMHKDQGRRQAHS